MSFFDDASAGLTESFTFTRYTRDVDTAGRVVSPSTATASGNGVFEPLSGRDLLRLPEGERKRNWVSLWTSAQLEVGDAVSYGGKAFETTHVDAWNTHGGYTRAQLVEIES